MRIVVNGERRAELESQLSDMEAGQVLEQVGAELFRQGQLVVKVELDGQNLTGMDRGQWGHRRDVEELCLETQTPKTLLESSIRVSREWLAPLRTELMGCADRFRLGDDAQAIDGLIRVTEGLRLLFMGMGQIQRLAVGQGLMQDAGLPERMVEDFQLEIPRLLDEIIQAQESRDWIQVADLLEYDVMDRLANWEDTMDTLLGSLA
jgi:hypothetical protein